MRQNWHRLSAAGLGLTTALCVSLILAVIAVLNVYYDTGDMVDVALCSHAAWHNNRGLGGPPLFPQSFFNIHMSPIFWVTNIASYMLPFGQVSFYALCIGAIYAGFGAAIYLLWVQGSQTEKPPTVPAACMVALAAAFSAAGMQALRLPHIEMAIPALMLWFCLALTRQRFRLAMACFVLCLTVREDAGLHLGGFLALWAVTGRISGLHFPSQRMLWRFAGVAFSYAIVALLVQKQMFTGADNFGAIYAGAVPWAHVTGELIARRVGFFMVERTWISLPLLITIGWAIAVRNPLLPLGYLAALPWLVFNLLAVAEPAGGLSFYYAFPFWFALGWPLAARQFRYDAGRSYGRWPYAAMLLASLVGWQDGVLTVYPLGTAGFGGSPFALNDTLWHSGETAQFTQYFAAHQAAFGDAGFDTPTMSLVLNDSQKIRWIGAWGDKTAPGMLVYYDNSYEWNRQLAPRLATGDYPYRYEVRGTNIRLAAAKPVETLLPGKTPFVAIVE